jgi:GNAT superfamily N-acetyltransferase
LPQHWRESLVGSSSFAHIHIAANVCSYARARGLSDRTHEPGAGARGAVACPDDNLLPLVIGCPHGFLGRAWFGQVVGQRETWVWEDEGAILGFIVLGHATVEYLYVEPEMTGRGIGGALLEHAKGRRPAGFCLWTFQRNEGARRFYECHGLRLIRLTDGEENEEKTPAALYA